MNLSKLVVKRLYQAAPRSTKQIFFHQQLLNRNALLSMQSMKHFAKSNKDKTANATKPKVEKKEAEEPKEEE